MPVEGPHPAVLTQRLRAQTELTHGNHSVLADMVIQSGKATSRRQRNLVVEGHSGRDLDGEDRCDQHVDGGAERRPPAGVGDELRPMLPEVFEAVRHVCSDDHPG